MAELGDAADSKSDLAIFYNPHDYSRNRTKSSQTSICTILTVTGFSGYYHTFWYKFGTYLAHMCHTKKEGSDRLNHSPCAKTLNSI
jgi:hypothetical protein